MESNYVKVKAVNNPEIVELPLELDNTLSLSVLTSQFPYSTGLKYKNPKNNQIRSVRRTDGKFFLSPDLQWDSFIFFCVFPLSRRQKSHKSSETCFQTRKSENLKSIYRKFPQTFDLFAVGMSFDTSAQDLDEYLNRFGPLLYCTLNLDPVFGQSKGQAYFRFKEIKSQNLCLSAVHVVDKTKITIKIPNEKTNQKKHKENKLYINNVSSHISREDLRAYFSQYGQVLNVFLPPDKRSFAFLTFSEDKSIDQVLSEGPTHIFNGARVNVNRVSDPNQTSGERKDKKKRNKSSEPEFETITRAKLVKITKPPKHLEKKDNQKLVENQPLSSQSQPKFNTAFNPPDFSQPPPLSFPPFPTHSSNISPSFPISPQSAPPFNTCSAPPHSSLSPFHSAPPPFQQGNPNTQPCSNYQPQVSHYTNHTSIHSENFSHSHYAQFSPFQNVPAASYDPSLVNHTYQYNQHYLASNNNYPQEIYSQPKCHYDEFQFPSQLNPSSFQTLLVNEIMSQIQQKKLTRSPFDHSEKNNMPQSGKSLGNCNQFGNSLNQVCFLNNRNIQMKNENAFEKPFNPHKTELISNQTKTDLSILKDPNVRKALEILQDTEVLEMLMKLSNHDKKKTFI